MPNTHYVSNPGYLTDAEILAVTRLALSYELLFANDLMGGVENRVHQAEEQNSPRWVETKRMVENAIFAVCKIGFDLQRRENP